jgi:sensor domain CHASE-containing protein
MSLQTKVLSLIAAVFLAYGALDFGIQRAFILPSFEALEREEAEKNLERALQALTRELDHLAVSATDWATWDDTYQFVQDHNPGYVESNLNSEALEGLKVDLLYIYDSAGEPAWGLVYDLDSEEEVSLEAFSAALSAGHPLVALPEVDAEAHGILLTERGPLIVAARPIVTSAREGPVRGAVVLGRFLDQTRVTGLADQARVQLTLTPLDGRGLSPEEAGAATTLGRSRRALIRTADGVDRVYGVVPDLWGRPALLARVDVPKAISARGRDAVGYALVSLLVAGLAIVLALVVGLRRMVLDPTRTLTAHAVAVGERDDLSARVALERRDELGLLARELNRMVERLADARRRLLEQSYQSGVAEMASGVLHNIGNALTPLAVQAEGLASTLRAAPVAELDLALGELAGGRASPERQADLLQFVGLVGLEVAGSLRQAEEGAGAVTRQVQHIGQILADQERFSRAARVLEPVALDALVAETLALVGERVRPRLAVEVDPSLAAAGTGRTARVALQQVFANLIINAAESVERAGRERGTLAIRVVPDEAAGAGAVHLSFADDGAGITPEDLPRIFERGFSTKPGERASGLGLHWSANTLTGLGGRLYAESAGSGRGACLHVVLPWGAAVADEGRRAA